MKKTILLVGARLLFAGVVRHGLPFSPILRNAAKAPARRPSSLRRFHFLDPVAQGNDD